MREAPSLRALCRTQFTIAHSFLSVALVTDLAAVVIGMFGAMVPRWAPHATMLLALFALIAVWVRGGSTRFADSAHDILRRLDLQDSLGRPVDPAIEADLIDDVPGVVQRVALKNEPARYFESAEEPGVRRLLENLRESAWWTKRLAGDMANVTGALSWILIAVGLLTLVGAVTGIIGSGAISNWISAFILFAIAQGPHHVRQRYAQLRDKSKDVQQGAEHLLAASDASEADALLVATDYHLARQGAPVIPTVWYEYRRLGLNKLWATVQSRTALPPAEEGT